MGRRGTRWNRYRLLCKGEAILRISCALGRQQDFSDFDGKLPNAATTASGCHFNDTKRRCSYDRHDSGVCPLV